MDSFNTLVEEYKSKSEVANLFGVMLYTDRHPNVKKILRDDDYWRSFDAITEERFCVFSVKPANGIYETPQVPNGLMALMIPIWKEPSENKKLIEFFELEDTKNLPMLLLFTQVGDKYLKIELELDESTQDKAYKSIKEQLEFSVNALSLIKKENLKNSSGLFGALSLHNDDRITWKRLKKSVNIYSALKKYLP